jgi:predicted permease
MGLIADLLFAGRRLHRAPGFTAATVLMLAVGIGISVSMFSVLRGVLLSGLPYPGGDRVVSVGSRNPHQQTDRGALTPAEAVQLAEAGAGKSSPFRRFGYYNWGGITLYDGTHPREIPIAVVSPGFFPTLGLQPLLGHWFSADEHGHASQRNTVVLSYLEWQRLLGGRPDAIGKLVDSSEGLLRVVGVMPPEFGYPDPEVGAWLPHGRFRSEQPSYQKARYIYGVARLADDPSAPAVAARLDALAAELRTRYALPDEGWRFAASALMDDLVGDLRGTLWSAFAIAVLVLLIACTNVAILVDARQAARGHEQALAHALGASPARIWRTVMLELALLAGLGVGLGVLGSAMALGALRDLAKDSVPRAGSIALDPAVLAFAVVVGLLAPFLVAAAGAVRQRYDAAAALRGGGRGMVGAHAGVRRLLPAVAVAFSTISLVAAAAFGLSLISLEDVDPGFRAAGVRALQLYRWGSPGRWQGFAEQTQERLAALPGITAVAITSAAPLSVNGRQEVDLQVPGRPQLEPFRPGLRRVSAGYLRLMGIPLLAGRDISTTDRAGSEPAAVVSRVLARRSFAGGSPLGQPVALLVKGERINCRIVGVMGDIRNDGLRAPAAPEVLVSFAQNPWPTMTFLARTRGPVATIDAQMADQVWAIDPRQAVTRQFTLAGELDAQLQTIRFFSYTVGVFAFLALVLAVFGVYAVAALQQRRRVREFGLRLAVGARPAVLGLQIVREGLRVVAPGAALGLVGAWSALQLISAQTFGLETRLPWVMVSGVAIMALAALAALLLPALRAARTDPMTALRYE